uniref:Endo/exonuclease/phosphatase domain-containing protein n=2 Tax=Macrostomum lignano TaxID=282301 RepID=A0A1I8HPV7_9PLAT
TLAYDQSGAIMMEELPKLPPRQWVSVSQHATEETFTLASYNILSEQLLRKSSYFHKIKPENWNRDVRHLRLITELESLNTDLLCLQEVDRDYWVQHLETDLRLRGFTICACSWRSAAPVEGVVICARDATFRRVNVAKESSGLNDGGCLSDLVTARLLNARQPDFEALSEYASAPQRYCLLRLEHRATGRQLTIGSAHAVAMIAETASAAKGGAFLVCGDFNSTPDSLAYHCVVRKTGEYTSSSWESLQKQQLPLMKVLLGESGKQFCRGQSISSAYLDVLGSEPACTLNLTNNSGCVDFIFYELQHLRPLAALEVPSWYIQRDKDCTPDHNLASDHLSIAAKFSTSLAAAAATSALPTTLWQGSTTAPAGQTLQAPVDHAVFTSINSRVTATSTLAPSHYSAQVGVAVLDQLMPGLRGDSEETAAARIGVDKNALAFDSVSRSSRCQSSHSVSQIGY